MIDARTVYVLGRGQEVDRAGMEAIMRRLDPTLTPVQFDEVWECMQADIERGDETTLH